VNRQYKSESGCALHLTGGADQTIDVTMDDILMVQDYIATAT
jgi:hypothetical protein